LGWVHEQGSRPVGHVLWSVESLLVLARSSTAAIGR